MKPKQSNNKKQLSPLISPFLSPSFQRPQENSEMDWSMDTPQASASPLLHISPASEHVPLPHVPLHNMGSNSKNRTESAEPSVLDYGEGQLVVASAWDGAHHALSIFGMGDMVLKDTESMYEFIRRMRNYIKHHPVNKVTIGNEFTPVVKQLWKLFDNIYVAKWVPLIFNREKTLTIRKYIGECIVSFYVVATTCWNGTHSMLTSAKLLIGYLVVGITRELNKELSLYYLLYIYIASDPCYNNIYPALKFMHHPYVLLLIHMCFP